MASQSEINEASLPAGSRRSPGKGNKGKKGKDQPRSGWRLVVEVIAYLVMLVLVLIYFTGKGLFIYEGF